jgi:hypothetical protein
MRKFKHAISLAVLVAVSALGLYGCGGENPTATPLVPTATTVVEVATATTAAMEAPTATTAGSSGNGGISGSATDILKQSGDAMKGVKSYHFILKSEAAGVSTTGEGDFVLPDKGRMTLDLGVAGKTEMIFIGTTTYTKIPGSDSYIEADTGTNPLAASADTAAFAQLAKNATIVGDETLDGVDTTHIKFSYNAADVATGTNTTPIAGAGEVDADIWIEKSTAYVHQFKSVSSIAGATANTTVTYSKFNEDVTPPIEKPTNIQQMPTLPTLPSP